MKDLLQIPNCTAKAQHPSPGKQGCSNPIISSDSVPIRAVSSLCVFLLYLSVLKFLKVMNTYCVLSLLYTAQVILSSQGCIALASNLDECYVPDTVLVSVLINHAHNGSCIQTI